MRRPSRYRRPGMSVSAVKSLLFSAGAGGIVLKAAPDTTTSIDLTWTAAIPKPDDYRIESSTDGVTFSTVTTVSGTVTTYNDTGLTESTRYWYRVIPVLNSVDQTASNIANTYTVPDTPTSLTATAISSTQIDLAWTDVSTGNTAQSIQRRSPAGSGSYSFIASVGATATSYSDTGLVAATQYEYQVAATNPATQSAWSTAADATTTGGGPPASSWSIDYSSGEPWSNGTDYLFTSTVSTTRTYVDSSGYIAPCVANLQTHSEDFTNAVWVRDTGANNTITANTVTAPDGTTTADTFTDGSNNTPQLLVDTAVSITSGVTYTISIYAKQGTLSTIQIGGRGVPFGTNEWANFNLSAGTVGSVGTAVTGSDATIENVGSGWYRCKLRMVAVGNATGAWFLATTSGGSGRIPSYSGGTGTIYIWGAQLVVGSEALPYSKTTTAANGIPRLTHNSSGSRLGLLVEEQRANVCQRSEELGNAYWTASNVTVTSNSIAAPDNQTTAELLLETTGTATHGIFVNGNITGLGNGTAKTISCFVKQQNRSQVALHFRGVGGTSRATQLFDINAGAKVGGILINGSPTATASGIDDYGNGWYRIWITATISGSAEVGFVILLSNTTGTNTPNYSAVNQPEYAGNTANGIYVWGCQAEDGVTTPSSYIPTTTASVTRSADLAYIDPANVTNWGKPGSFVVEYYKPLNQAGNVVVAEDDLTPGDDGRLGVSYSSGGPRIVYGTSSAGSGGTDVAGLNKVGWAWDGSGAATRSALNGVALDTSLGTTFDPADTNGISLGGDIDFSALPLTVSNQPNVIIRKVTFWNSQLSAADLNTLTA